MIAVQGKAAIRVGMRNAVPNDVVPQKEAAGAAHWRSSLRTRIALWAGLVNVALLLLLVLGTAWFARRLILDDARRELALQRSARAWNKPVAGAAPNTPSPASLAAAPRQWRSSARRAGLRSR